MMRTIVVLILLAGMGFQSAEAQSGKINKRADTYMMRQITKQLEKELNDVPVSVRRMAIYKINYKSSEFNNQDVAFIKGEIESTFRNNTPVSVISPPELDPSDKLKIMGSDSTLRLLNIKGRSLADMSPELLEGIAQKYSVSGLTELTIQKLQTEGLVVFIRIMNPQSREIVWSKSFASFPVEDPEEENLGKRIVLSFGATMMENEWYSTDTAPDVEIPVESTALNYSLSFGYRQPLNDLNSSYLGIFTGMNVIRANENRSFESTLWEMGITFDQAISRKSEQINDYRLMLGLDASVWIAQGDKNGNLITASPSLMFNLTKNIGFEVRGLVFLSDRSVKNSGAFPDTYTYGQLGYGVKAYVQF
jgi:hypothetical protein